MFEERHVEEQRQKTFNVVCMEGTSGIEKMCDLKSNCEPIPDEKIRDAKIKLVLIRGSHHFARK